MTCGADHVDRIQAEWRRERPDIDPSPQGVFGRLFRLTATLSARISAVHEAHGLTEGEFDVLCALRRAGAPYERQPAELARTTMITTGGLTKRLDRLEAAGLVERAPSSSGDGRAKMARLTETGLRVIDAAFTDHMANESRLIALLGSGDQASLEKALRSWASALDAEA